MKIRPKIAAVLVFNAVYIGLAIMSAFSRANYEFVMYIGVVIIAVLIVTGLYGRYGLSAALLWMMSGWGLLHMAGGLVNIPAGWPTGEEPKVLYNLWLIEGMLKFDQLVHAYGFGTATWLIWQVLQRALAERLSCVPAAVRPTGGILFLCAIGSMGLGALNEIVEFLAMVLAPETNVGGYVNTALDLVSNLIGASVAALVIYVCGRIKV